MYAIANKYPFRVGVTSSIVMHLVIGLFMVYVLTYQPPPIRITDYPPMITAVPVIMEPKPRPVPKPKDKPALEKAEVLPEEMPPLPPEMEIAPSPAYYALVHGMLEAHKRYPRRALERGDQGVVVLWFVIDRNGQVINYRIEQSSGSTILDGEVVRLIKRVNKFPMFLDDLSQDFVEITMPIRFVIVDK